MNNLALRPGLGDTPTECEMYGSNPPPGCPGYKGDSSGSGKTIDWSGLLETGLDIFKTFKTSTQQPNVPGAPPPPPAGVSLKKVALIGGGVALVAGTVIYFATRKKKK